MLSLIRNLFNSSDDDDNTYEVNLLGSRQTAEALKHSQTYSKFLKIYLTSVRANIVIKSILKIVFFLATMGAMLWVVYIFSNTIQYAIDYFSGFENAEQISIESILSMVTILVPAISSLIVALLKIPRIIAEYLFNIQEDTYMKSIIKNIQDYDRAMFALQNKVEELLINNKAQTEQTRDEEIEDSPVENAN